MTQIPAGWYPDPAPQTYPGRQRYWDGTRWTEHLPDPQPPAPPVYPATYPPAYPQYQPYGQPVQKQPPTTPDGQRLSGWWRRVLATVIDGLVLSPVYVGILAVFLANRWDEIKDWFNAYSDAVDAGTTPPSPPDLFHPYSTTMLGVVAVYSIFLAVYTLGFWRWKQATPGKLAAGIRIRRRDTPGPMPWSTMLARFLFVQGLALAAYIPIAGLLFALVALLDYLWPLWDPHNQALHEKLARTNVVFAQSSTDHPSTADLTAAGLPPRW
jgi:uncharacterized RDD family membrane protein YckC